MKKRKLRQEDYSKQGLIKATNTLISISEDFDSEIFKSKNLRLYHYTSPEGMIGILNPEELVFRFSRFDCVNDSSEGVYVFNLYKEILLSLEKEGKISRQFFDLASSIEMTVADFFTSRETANDQTEQFNDTKIGLHLLPFSTYLCCFSENPDSLPMWNYYTKGESTRGYNIGVSQNRLLMKRAPFNMYDLQVEKVLYEKAKQGELITQLIMKVQDSIPELGEYFAGVLLNSQLCDWRFLFKHECFSHENEVRAILKIPTEWPEDVNEAKKFEVSFRNSNGYAVPYVEMRFPKYIVKSICTGPQLDYVSTKTGITALLDNRGYKGIDIVKSEIPTRY